MCTDRFPTLETFAALTDSGSAQQRRRRVQAALQGVDTLVILRDDIHPALHDVGTGQLDDQVVLVPPRWGTETICSHARSLTLIDAAVAARVGHIVLHSSLGATGQRREAPINAARMGGSEHQSLRRTLEEHLEECSDQHGTRHTILQAAPYATLQQLTAMQQRRAHVGQAEAAVSLPLTSPECLGRASVDAALGLPVGMEVRTTKQRSNYRCVTREVISSLE